MRRETIDWLACPFDKKPLQLFPLSSQQEVEEGVLYCQQCSRWFPILEGIPCLMPDKYRDVRELEILRRNSERLPAHIVRNGKPFNISNAPAGQSAELDAEVSEMRLRDDYAVQRHPGRAGWHTENFTSLTSLATFTRLLGVKHRDLVLDVGIGAGTALSRKLAHDQIQLVGVDFSFESLRICKRRHDLDGENRLSVIQADALHLPLREELFDKITSSQVIQHLPSHEDREAAVKEINRVLKPGGVFVFETLNEHYIKRLMGKIPGLALDTEPKEKRAKPPGQVYLYLYSHSELKKLLGKNFTVKIDGIFSLYPVAELRRKLFQKEISSRCLHKLECAIDRRLPSRWWAQALIATCRK